MEAAHPIPASVSPVDIGPALVALVSARHTIRRPAVPRLHAPVASPLDGSPLLRREERPAGLTEVAPPRVNVLGSVTVDRTRRSFSSARALDVVTCLAFHRDGADADQLRTWIWPADSLPTNQAFANVMSRARQALGSHADGHPWLTRAGSDRVYRLLPQVRTDVDEFHLHVANAAASSTEANTLGHLRSALTLVRGRPFTGGGSLSYLWADRQARSQITFLVDETAHRAADLAIALGDFETARAALFIGQQIIPGCEQCYERRFQVAAAEGNLADLRGAMAELRVVVAEDFPGVSGQQADSLVSRHLQAVWERLVADVTVR